MISLEGEPHLEAATTSERLLAIFTTIFIATFTKIDKEQKKRFRKEALNGSGEKQNFMTAFITLEISNNSQVLLAQTFKES